MTEPTSGMQIFARSLLLHECGACLTPEDTLERLRGVTQKLCRHLARTFGDAGVRALMTRSLASVRREHPIFTHAWVDDALGLNELRDGAVARETLLAAFASLVAALIALLATFIGLDLVLRFVREIWPETPFAEPGAEAEEEEKAKP